MKKLHFVLIIILLFSFSLLQANDSANSIWQKVDDGLFIAKVPIPQTQDSIIVLKIDPHFFSFRLLCADEQKFGLLTAEQWAKKFDLICAINAGMYQTDHKSNVGYMKNYKYINNSRVHSQYFSVAAFNPKVTGIPPFRIFDIDEVKIEKIKAQYHTVIQNLRLIKRPGKNRWSQKLNKWSEAALGEDSDGNALFIFSRFPLTMHDFNNLLISSGVNIVCAQHLEGGPEASFYFSTKNWEVKIMGSYETSFNENNNNVNYWPIPNVIGIKKK